MSYNYKRPLNHSYKPLPYTKTTTEVSIYDETFPNKFNFPYQKHFKPHYKPKHNKHLYHNNYTHHNNNTYNSSLLTLFPHSSSFHISIPQDEEAITTPSQVLLNKYEGLCNYIIFAKESSLYITKTSIHSLAPFLHGFIYG
jgi:hypothetical protein